MPPRLRVLLTSPMLVDGTVLWALHQPQSHLQELAVSRWELLSPRGCLITAAMQTVPWPMSCHSILSSPPPGLQDAVDPCDHPRVCWSEALQGHPCLQAVLPLPKPTPEWDVGTVGASVQPCQQVQVTLALFGQTQPLPGRKHKCSLTRETW